MADSGGEKQREQYFSALAPDYARLTGNTTRDLLAEVLDSLKLGINGYSVIHDNASGPGTATEAVLAWTAARGQHPKIKATDSSSAMIDALDAIVAKRKDENGWKDVKTEVLNSWALSTIKNDTFTHVFCNFSIFAFDDPYKCLVEIHRTLRPAGIAVITGWKRFAVSNVIAMAQSHVKGAGWAAEHEVKVAAPEFMEGRHTAKMVDEAGWESGKIKSVEVRKVVKEGSEDWNGLYDFLTTMGKGSATKDWSESEVEQWGQAVKVAMTKEKDENGGLLFVAWVVLARRWDALTG